MIMDRKDLLDKLFRLEKQRAEVEGMKKSMSADYRDQLKDIKNEIKDVMEEIDNPAPSVDSEPVDFEG